MRALVAAALLAALPAHAAQPAPPGPSIARIADMPSGAPAFEVRNAAGSVTMRIECLKNPYNSPDIVAARLLASPGVMANIIAKDGRLESVAARRKHILSS